ncbi:Uncharacterized protein TCM_010036 [Theobroma cacao]|uniref:Uncharacterized protein n=1 Tax=Theobroma cacao TaxID=3641 RepID=A0A061E7B8_THECC|nr:Uncharacterized protein TCM_010036 [Theobroma cacao]
MRVVKSDLSFAGLTKLVEDVIRRNVPVVYITIKESHTNVMSHNKAVQHGETVEVVMPFSDKTATLEDNTMTLEYDTTILEDNATFDERNEDLFLVDEDIFDDNSDDRLVDGMMIV